MMFVVGRYISLEVAEIVVVGFTVVGISCAMVLDRFFWRLTPPLPPDPPVATRTAATPP